MREKAKTDRNILRFASVRVEEYAGYKAAERPLAFYFQDQYYRVGRILDRWYQGGVSPRDQRLDYFKVLTTGNQEFILRYNPLFEDWSVLIPAGE